VRLVSLVAAVVGQAAQVAGAVAAALGVFCWLEVMDLDLFFGFLFLCLVLHVV
jgi:hypothetical protein